MGYQLFTDMTADVSEALMRGMPEVAYVPMQVELGGESFTGEDGILQPKSGWTDIFIYPGYRFKAIDALVTNFHLPESTLIMLVSALAGRENVLCAYEEAVKERYRFFSFGDAMFIH